METVKDYHEVMDFLSKLNNDPKGITQTVKDYDEVKDLIDNPKKAKQELAQKLSKEILEQLHHERKIRHYRKIRPIDKYEQRTYTYIAIDKRTGLYKIGKTTDLCKRQKDFTKAICGKSKSKPLLDIEIIYYCTKCVEVYLHQMYDNCRVRDLELINKYYPKPQFQGIRKEWFELTQSDIDYILQRFEFKQYDNKQLTL